MVCILDTDCWGEILRAADADVFRAGVAFVSCVGQQGGDQQHEKPTLQPYRQLHCIVGVLQRERISFSAVGGLSYSRAPRLSDRIVSPLDDRCFSPTSVTITSLDSLGASTRSLHRSPCLPAHPVSAERFDSEDSCSIVQEELEPV